MWERRAVAMLRVVKPKNQRVKRALEARAPKVHENAKTAMFVKGPKTSETVMGLLRDLMGLKKPEAVSYLRKSNDVRPFEDETGLEFFGQKSDASLFCVGSHQKKRPDNLVFGRMFDGHVLDMLEVGVTGVRTMDSFKIPDLAAQVGGKPLFAFLGDGFEAREDLGKLKNLLVDFFRGKEADTVNLKGLERVICVTHRAADDAILFRQYHVRLKRNASAARGTPAARLPRVELEEMGPRMDMALRRTRFASADLLRQAMREPTETFAAGKKGKNVSTDAIKGTVGRVYVSRQDLNEAALHRPKGTSKATAAKRHAKQVSEEQALALADAREPSPGERAPKRLRKGRRASAIHSGQ